MASERPLTLAEVREKLFCHVTPDPTDADLKFRDALNQALETTYAEAIWDGTRVRKNVNEFITDCVLTLPYEFDAAIAFSVDGCPQPIFDESLEFSPNGPGNKKAGEGGVGIIDLGFAYQDDSTLKERAVRSYKFTQSVDTCEVVAILKKRYLCVSLDTDLVVPSNLRALKQMLMAINYEDAGDLEQSESYWQSAYSILNAEKQTANIGKIPTPPQNPHGIWNDPVEPVI